MRNLLLNVFVLIAGCGGDDTVACDFTATSGPVTVHSCGEVQTDDAESDESECKDAGHVKAKLVDSCPTDNVLGTCVATKDDKKLTQYYYKSEGLTAALAKQGCDALGGTFTAK